EAPLLAQGISGDTLGWGGYQILTALVEDHLAMGHSVLLDCVCWTRALRVEWQALADRFDAAFRSIEVVCSDELVHRTRIETRNRKAHGLKDINWHRVEEARQLYEPWDSPRLVLDSANPLLDL